MNISTGWHLEQFVYLGSTSDMIYVQTNKHLLIYPSNQIIISLNLMISCKAELAKKSYACYASKHCINYYMLLKFTHMQQIYIYMCVCVFYIFDINKSELC